MGWPHAAGSPPVRLLLRIYLQSTDINIPNHAPSKSDVLAKACAQDAACLAKATWAVLLLSTGMHHAPPSWADRVQANVAAGIALCSTQHE